MQIVCLHVTGRDDGLYAHSEDQQEALQSTRRSVLLKQDQDWGGWSLSKFREASTSHPTILRITMCNKGAQFVVLRCIRKGREDQGKGLRTMIKIESPFASFTDESGASKCYTMGFPTALGISPDLILYPKTSLLQRVFLTCPLFNVTQSLLLMNFMTNPFYYVKRKNKCEQWRITRVLVKVTWK